MLQRHRKERKRASGYSRRRLLKRAIIRIKQSKLAGLYASVKGSDEQRVDGLKDSRKLHVKDTSFIKKIFGRVFRRKAIA